MSARTPLQEPLQGGPLKGLRVIVTRPQKQADIWCEKLRELGASTTVVPVLALEPVTEVEQVQAIKNVVLDFDLYQKAIFVSQNAVDFALQWLEDYWPQLPQGINYFAVGDATARSLQAYGLEVSALTAASSGAMNSESLVQAPELQQVSGEKIVIFRGCGGRGQMAEVLRARGASVNYCELYKRVIPTLAAQDVCAAFGDESVWQTPQVIALHSGESLQHFMQILVGTSARNLDTDRIMQLPVLVPGERVAQLARDAGFARILVAENATDQAMSAALLAQF
jgi:uroporphyrinogen-III synthase